MTWKQIISLALIFSMTTSAIAQPKADDVVGIWLTSGDHPAKVQIYKSGEKYFGKIVWLQSTVDNKPMVDANNPDEKKRNQPIIGLIMLKSFEFDDDEWDDGTIYDPENGKTYSCHLTLKDINTLRVRGYIGIPLFGRTEIWTRSKL
jgi:uncharacterized protein (DUF2147 family)